MVQDKDKSLGLLSPVSAHPVASAASATAIVARKVRRLDAKRGLSVLVMMLSDEHTTGAGLRGGASRTFAVINSVLD